MKRLLNTLYVTTQGAWLAREGETVLVKVEGEIRMRVPIHLLGSIVCFGVVTASAPLMGMCAARGVTLAFMTDHGRFLARIQGPVSGNVLLRREQYRRSDSPSATGELARAIVVGKIMNSRTVLRRAARDRPGGEDAETLGRAADRMSNVIVSLRDSADVDFVRGKEGEAAKAYFEAFDAMITSQRESFYFKTRSRRPPLDNMNALLSFLYALVTNDVVAALEGVGLDPQVGFLHRDRPGRPGLALDLVEELRPFLADRLALALVNRLQVRDSSFDKTEGGGVRLKDEARKEILVAFQKRKQEELLHPFLEEKVAIGLVPHVQAMLMARHLRGDLDGYPPFVWR